MSNVDKVQGIHAPMGQFINIKRYPPADYRGVSAPVLSGMWLEFDWARSPVRRGY
jgi:hypothetical protein